MKIKTQIHLSEVMAQCAADGEAIRVDPTLILPGASQSRMESALTELGCKESVDYLPGESTQKGIYPAYTFWLTDETAMRVIPIWRKFLSPSAAAQWSESKESDALKAVSKYSELYPITKQSELDTTTKGADMVDMLQAIMEKIEDHGIGLRRQFPPETVRLYRLFLAERRSGRCPISHELLVDSHGKLLDGAEVDHFYSRSYVGVNGGWIIRATENQKLRDPAYRAAINTRFLAFQEDLAQWMKARHGAEFDFETT